MKWFAEVEDPNNDRVLVEGSNNDQGLAGWQGQARLGRNKKCLFDRVIPSYIHAELLDITWVLFSSSSTYISCTIGLIVGIKARDRDICIMNINCLRHAILRLLYLPCFCYDSRHQELNYYHHQEPNSPIIRDDKKWFFQSVVDNQYGHTSCFI